MTTNTEVASVSTEIIYVPTPNAISTATMTTEVFFQIKYPNTRKRHVYETT